MPFTPAGVAALLAVGLYVGLVFENVQTHPASVQVVRRAEPGPAAIENFETRALGTPDSAAMYPVQASRSGRNDVPSDRRVNAQNARRHSPSNWHTPWWLHELHRLVPDLVVAPGGGQSQLPIALRNTGASK